MDTEAVAVLKKARALLAKRGGWIRGAFYKGRRDNPKALCAMGAINFAATGDPAIITSPGSVKAIRVLQKIIGHDQVGEWNDDPRRTKRYILAGISEAIKLAKAAK